MNTWRKCFGVGDLKIIGMIHVLALPGTPRNSRHVNKIIDHAKKEAEIYVDAGIDSILIENMHDIPYVKPPSIGPEITAVMTRVCAAVRGLIPLSVPCGVQVLAGGNKEALAVATAAELQFVRCEGFVFGHVADEGWMNACAGQLMRYRKQIGADNVLVLTDIKKKHSAHAVTADVDIGETAKAAEFFLADGVIVTGTATGSAAEAGDVTAVRASCRLPVIVGSGVTLDNVGQYSHANALIVGSYFKDTGSWNGILDGDKIRTFMDKVHAIRGS